ncbi:MAG TPA: GAF domain-containing protein [Bacteroidetes bacterium]|nr:GAF domain-containing protein [Bacteroidota bacterium]
MEEVQPTENRETGILLFDPSARILHANQAAAESLGLVWDSAARLWNFAPSTAEINQKTLAGFAQNERNGPLNLLSSAGESYQARCTALPSGGENLFLAEWPVSSAQQQKEISELLEKILDLFASEASKDDKYSELAKLLLDFFRARAVLFFLTEHARGRFRLAASASVLEDKNVRERIREKIQSVGLGEGLISRLLETRSPLFVADLPGAPEKKAELDGEMLRRLGMASLVSLPVVFQGKVLAVVDLLFDRPDRLREVEKDAKFLAKFLVPFIADLEVEQARENRFRKQLDFLKRLPEIWKFSDSYEDVFRKTAQLAVDFLNYWDIGVFRFIPERSVLKLIAVAGRWADKFPPDYEQSVDKGVIGLAARKLETQYIRDVTKEPLYYQPFHSHAGAELAVPIALNGRLLGGINLEAPHPDAFDRLDVEHLSVLGNLLALYLDYSFHLKQQEFRLNTANFLADLSYVLHKYGGEKDLPARFIRFLQKELGVYYVSYYRYHPDRGQLEKVAQAGGKFSPRPIGSFWPADKGALGKVVQERKYVYFPDISVQPEGYVPIGDVERGAELSLPVQFGDELFGIVNVESEEPYAFQPDLISILQSGVDHFAAAMRNASLLEEIREQKQKLDTVLLHMVDGILLMSEEGAVSVLNPAGKRALQKLIGRGQVGGLEDLPFHHRVRERLARKEENFGFEYEDARGNVWFVHGAVLPAQGDGSQLMLLLRDITHEKKEEEAKVRNERTRMAVEMAGSIAHELNQPLTGILGYCSLLLEDLDPESEIAEDVRLIEEQAARIAQLVRKFQNVVKIRTKAYPGGSRIVDWEDSEVKE